ncbi:sugar O-acetyltransferase [Limosilactobacillus sp. RRLNB_1_1]|uniref:Sugar O-acetyltransferase n=1 Tax=Limosilactobacillus albertensis TaxID=2759752 RepID=A0A7W3Y7Z9_9LACO|nr:sugar O-acetyltransferase [Limosilactobacillus albertensis]MBB1068937.1 sugar O-acetyltransferase [Limosilactobacillus albertensis]MCD7118697.1 sugar O-acetyltransferase [Limosilactobacillus albertensis]MCD7128154.1 sugar O-acetyltransferase [Limosilactobacillus albertensis]
MSEIDKLNNGEWFNFGSPEIVARKLNAAKLSQQFNAIPETEPEEQEKMARKILGSAGENLVIHSDWKFDNGKNIHVGDNFLANYNWTVLDVGEVKIGNNVWIGPNTDIYTVNHPIEAEGRRQHLSKVSPVVIGDDVWICGKVTIVPGVTVGHNAIIAAGSVVTKNVPANTMVAGVPAKVVKKLSNKTTPSQNS